MSAPRETLLRFCALLACLLLIAYLGIVARSAEGVPRLVFPTVFVLFLLGRYGLTGRRPW